jgi:sarcosine oxidase subunit gamma
MSGLALKLREQRVRLGLKGPQAADLLLGHGIVVPTAPNTWTHSEEFFGADGLLAARLGATEFFLEEGPAGTTVKRLSASLDDRAPGGHPPGVYPVLREDWAFLLGGERVHDVLAQVCNVNFAALPLASHPLIMTLMIGVAVLVVPLGDQFRIWCDPTFGPYLGGSLGNVVIECGGRYTGASA